MRAIDTNVLVRLIARDGARQVARAEAFIEKGAWVSHLALAETVWVLESVYALSAKQIAVAIEMLLNHAHLTLQDGDVVANALERYRAQARVDFTDCLILETALKHGHRPLGTFDRHLGNFEGAERIVGG